MKYRFNTAIAVSALGLFGIALVLSLSCDTPDFDAPSRITSLRVLAIKSEPREAGPGDELIISGLAVNKDGTPYMVPMAWFLGGTIALSGADRSSDLPEGLTHIQMSEDDPFVLTIPMGDEFEAIFGEYNPEGTVLTIGMGIGDLEDPTLSIKTMMVRDNNSFENPVFHGIDFMVEGRYVLPDEEGIYDVGNTKAIKVIANVDFPTGDDKTFHWYTATKGLKEFTVDKAVEWSLPKDQGVYDIYCVARENTGTEFGDGEYNVKSAGVDWNSARIRVSADMTMVNWAN